MRLLLPTLLALLATGPAWGQVEFRLPEPEVGAPDPGDLVDDPGRTALDQLFRKIALDVMPRQYEDVRDWGHTHPFTTGLKVERDGLRIETRRRRKDLNHGTWRRYSVQLVDEEEFELSVLHAHRTDDGRIAFDVHLIAKMDVFARQSRYRRGVQMYSLSAEGTAKVDLLLSCVTDVRVERDGLLPMVVIEPVVTDADLILLDFELHRISKLSGDIAEELGRTVRGRLAKRLAEKDDKLVDKLNARFEKDADKLRLSLTKLAGSQFKSLVELAQ